MDIRIISEDYAVSPQISCEDLPKIAAAGYKMVICNRPDHEIPSDICMENMKAAADAAGLAFYDNPIDGREFGTENIRLQSEAMAQAEGPVLAYCASGTRCTIVWLCTQAGNAPIETLLGRARAAGYQLDHLTPMLENLSAD